MKKTIKKAMKKTMKKQKGGNKEPKLLKVFESGWKIFELLCDGGNRAYKKWESPAGKGYPSETTAKKVGFANV